MSTGKGIQNTVEEREGKVFFDGQPVSKIADEFGTPTYVYSESRIRENYSNLSGAFSRAYPKFRLYYALKCNNNLSLLKILKQAGAGADCSSPAEILLAKLAGFAPEDLLYTGNYNSDDELAYAIGAGALLNLDDASFVTRVKNLGAGGTICFRVNPGIGKGGNENLVFAGPDVKFGVTADKAVDAYRKAKEAGFTQFGIHMMTGSNILDPQYFAAITGKLMDIAGLISKELGIKFSFVNIGGGFGVPYRLDETPLDVNRVAQDVVLVFKEKCREYSLGEPELRIEPGRYIMCDAGAIIARVHAVKQGSKTFVGCDAGMNTLLRPVLYNSYHHILVDGKSDSANEGMHKAPTAMFNVCGQVCENTDQFAKDRSLPHNVSRDDVLVICNAGAYGFGMSSQYNSRPRAAEVLVAIGSTHLIREREGPVDLLNRQRVPAHLLK